MERPARIAALLKGIEGLPVLGHPVRSYSTGPIRAVHDPGLLPQLHMIQLPCSGPTSACTGQCFSTSRNGSEHTLLTVTRWKNNLSRMH